MIHVKGLIYVSRLTHDTCKGLRYLDRLSLSTRKGLGYFGRLTEDPRIGSSITLADLHIVQVKVLFTSAALFLISTFYSSSKLSGLSTEKEIFEKTTKERRKCWLLAFSPSPTLFAFR